MSYYSHSHQGSQTREYEISTDPNSQNTVLGGSFKTFCSPNIEIEFKSGMIRSYRFIGFLWFLFLSN